MEDRIRLLIVDDEVRFIESMARRLRMRGFEVSTALSGVEALAVVANRAIDVVLLDLKMPGMSGEEVLARLRADHPLVEVIILTGHGSIDSAVKCTQVGSHSYLQKPCETDVLLGAVKDAFGRRVARRLKLDEDAMDELLRAARGEGPLGILKRLRQLDREGK